MNYIELVNKFWKCNNEIPIGTNATALYFYLLNVCNTLGWKETFKHSDRYISLQLGIAINTVRTAKNRLKQLGLIDFKSPDKSSRGLDGITKYSFGTLSKYDSDAGIVPDSDAGIVPDSDTDTLDKLNKTKQEKDTNVSKKKEEESSSHSPGISDFEKFNLWIKANAPYCSNVKNFTKQLTEEEFLKLKKSYTGSQISEIILQIENRKDLRKRYTHLYRTVLNWAKKEYGK